MEGIRLGLKKSIETDRRDSTWFEEEDRNR